MKSTGREIILLRAGSPAALQQRQQCRRSMVSPLPLTRPEVQQLLESELGHVWTAPRQDLSDVAALVGCGHVSGLLMRQVWPRALMLCVDQVPNKSAHFGIGTLIQAGSPEPRSDRICITSSCPRQLVLLPIYLPARVMPPARSRIDRDRNF